MYVCVSFVYAVSIHRFTVVRNCYVIGKVFRRRNVHVVFVKWRYEEIAARHNLSVARVSMATINVN